MFDTNTKKNSDHENPKYICQGWIGKRKVCSVLFYLFYPWVDLYSMRTCNTRLLVIIVVDFPMWKWKKILKKKRNNEWIVRESEWEFPCDFSNHFHIYEYEYERGGQLPPILFVLRQWNFGVWKEKRCVCGFKNLDKKNFRLKWLHGWATKMCVWERKFWHFPHSSSPFWQNK